MYGKTHSREEFLKKLAEITEANLQNEQFGVSELAHELGMSRSNLHRKVDSILKISVSQLIRQKRLEKGLELLRHTSATVSEVAYLVGFGSVTYFIKCFHDFYGYPPGEIGGRKEHADAVETGAKDIHSKRKWLLPAGIGILAIILLIIIIEAVPLKLMRASPRTIQKTIAVLPLEFEGSDSMQMVAGGLRQSLLNSMMNIQNLVLRSETSVEQYRENKRPVKEIVKELKVDYIIEMKGIQAGNMTSLQVNLADAVNDKYLWRANYPVNMSDRNSTNLPNIIANEILEKTSASMSPREKTMLTVPLSDNPGALNYYLQALNHMALKKQLDTPKTKQESIKEMDCAKRKLLKAVMLDSNFYAAYVRLGHIYIDVLQSWAYDQTLKNAYLDTGFIYTEKALLLVDKTKSLNYSWATGLKSNYYYYKGDIEKAKEIYEQYKILSKPWKRANYEGMAHKEYVFHNYYGCIENVFNYLELTPEDEIIHTNFYSIFCNSLVFAGFPEVAEKYEQICFSSTEDTLYHFVKKSSWCLLSGNYNGCIDNASEMRTASYTPVFLKMVSYIFLKQYEQAAAYAAELEKKGLKNSEEIAFVFRKMGKEQKADEYYSRAIEYYLDLIKNHSKDWLKNTDASEYEPHIYLASAYSAMGEKNEALKYLREANKQPVIPF